MPPTLERLEPPGRSCCATRPATTSTAPSRTSPASATRPATCSGRCPTPSTPSDELTAVDRRPRASSTRCAWPGGCRRRDRRGPGRSDGAGRARPRISRAREYELVVREAGPRAQPGRAGRVLADVERALCLQALQLLLRTLPTEGEHVALGPGENAGAVNLPAGSLCAFKVESHNHPSAVEPFQGAATGWGDPARHLRPRRSADRGARLAALRVAARPPGPRALPARRGCRRDRPLRQLDRRPHHRRRGLLRGALRAQLPGQRDGASAWPRASG